VSDQPSGDLPAGLEPTIVQPAETPSQAAEPETPVVVAEPQKGQDRMRYGYFWGTGRRKSAVARVRIKPGDGKFLINKRELDRYFAEERDRKDAVAPLVATSTMGKFDVFVNVKGGGPSGQAGAVVLGVARALVKADASLERSLRDGGYLTRDSRMVERKKYGQRGARRRFQFSKR
jgi:small subunit ribosomal protein S9